MSLPYDENPGKQLLIDGYDKIRSQLLDWYFRLQNHESAPLFQIESSASQFLLNDNPELAGIFPGIVVFSNGYVFELLSIYWYGSLLLYTSMARVYTQLQLLRTDGCSNKVIADDKVIEAETMADNLATKVCQTVEFCQQPSVGDSRVFADYSGTMGCTNSSMMVAPRQNSFGARWLSKRWRRQDFLLRAL